MTRAAHQNGFILLPVVLAITLIAAIAFLVNTESALNVDMTANTTAAAEVEQVARAGLAHATWGVQNSGCAGDMGMTTVPFGQAGSDNYTATVTTPGGATTAYPNLGSDQDAWFRSDNPESNSATDSTYHLRRESGNLEYAVVRYDLSTLPAGAQINSAQARFYVESGKGHPEGPVTVHRVTADWTETGATWETLGDRFDSAVLDTIPAQPDAGDAWVTVNLTAQVQAWVNGGEPNYGIMLIPTGEGTHAEYISREGAASQQPRLDVIVGTGAASPVNIKVKGTLAGNPSPANDIERTLTRTKVPAYQPPGTITLQLGTDPGEDGMPDSFYDTRNYGGANYLQVHENGSDWQQYPLIRFDLGRLPRGAAVRSAQLELRLQSLNAPGTATIHQVTRSWVEGTRDGGGTADGATWFTHDGINPWTSAGGDINAPVVAETAINGSETWVGWEIAPLVERWLAGEPNHGLQIRPGSGLEQANFASKENTTVGVQPKLTITYACECGSPCLAPQGSGNVLMVVVNPSTLVPADAYKKALFESWGYAVTALSESANQSSYDSAVAGADVVYISETVNSTQVGSKLANAPIGVITEDGLYNDALGISNNAGVTTGSAINISDTSHYITGIFPAGPLEIYDADMEQLVIFNGPAPDLQTLADVGGYSSLVTLEAGATLKGGATAAGRRAMLPLGRVANFNWDYLNHNGRLIVQRTLQWGTGNTGGPPQNLLFVSAGSTPTALEQLRIDLIESWGYSVNLIDESDSQANFDTAMAANDVAYVSSTVSETTLGTKLTAASIGVVNELVTLVDEFGFAQEAYNYKSRIEIDVLDNSHYITQPFATGLLTIFTVNQNLHLMTSNKAPGLDVLAQVFNTGSLWDDSLGAIETGGALQGGGTAAGRRVLLPWGDASFNVTTLNADGQTLMQRAIEWAEGAGAPSTPPIAHWTFDEGSGPTAFDVVGGNDATLNGDTAWRTGTINGALDFDGSGDYIRTDNNFTPPPVGTITFWMRVSGSPAAHGRILGLDDTWEIRHVTTGTADGIPYGLVFDLGVSGTNTEFVTTTTIDTPGKWYHIAAAYDTTNDAYAVYIDGIPHKSGTYPSALTVPAANLLSMGTRTGSSNYFDGQLDDVRIYDQFLSAAEIAKLASGGGSQQEILLVVADATNLTAQDIARQTLLAGWSYSVATISASDTQANFDAAVASADAAYVVMQDSSTVLGTKLRDATIAVINEEVELRADIGFSANRDWPTTRTTVDIIDNSHYITSPFATGLLTIATAPIEVVTLSGQMAGGLQTLAQQDWGGPQNSLSVIDTGGALYGGGNAAGRRVQLPWGRVGFDINNLNTNGLKLMQRAIEWGVAGGGGGGGPPPGPGATLLASDDATVFESNPGANFGSETNLKAGKTSAQGGKLYSSGIRFDLSSLPAGATITSATLRLYQTFDSGTGTIDVGVYKATSTWDEATVTWNTLVDDGIQLVSSSVTLGTADWTEWVLPPALVQEWLDIANNGIALRYETGTKGKTVGFASKESTPSDFHPQLVVEYTAP